MRNPKAGRQPNLSNSPIKHLIPGSLLDETSYRSDLPGAEDYPAIWVSEDQGTTWRLASDKDL